MIIGETNCNTDIYKAVVENMIDAYSCFRILKDEKDYPYDFIFVDVNACFENITGLKRELVLNKKVSEVFSHIKDIETDFMELITKAVASGEAFKAEIYSLAVDKWFSCSAFCFEQGYISAIFHDITDTKLANENLRRNEEKYRSIFTAVKEAIFIADNYTGNIIDANPSACELYGYSKEEILNMNRTDFVADIDTMFVNIQKNIRHLSLHHRKKDGTIFPVDICISECIYNEDPVRIVTVRDITNHELVEDLKKEIEKNLLIINESKIYENLRTEFFANISHELRTPLNVILGSIQLIKLYLKNEPDIVSAFKYKKYSKIIHQNCFRLLRLVNNLIDITKIDAGYFELSLENKNVVNIIEEITLSVSEYMKDKEINLIFDTDTEERVMALDSDMIERIILNLLSNAVKFTKPGGSIYVNLYEADNNFIVSIKDTGIGIPEDKLENIFDRFVQVDKSLTRSREGSGIGLSLVKSLVELHEGNIKVVSKLGEGSEFIIELPIKLKTSKELTSTQEEGQNHGQVERIHIEFSDIYS